MEVDLGLVPTELRWSLFVVGNQTQHGPREFKSIWPECAINYSIIVKAVYVLYIELLGACCYLVMHE